MPHLNPKPKGPHLGDGVPWLGYTPLLLRRVRGPSTLLDRHWMAPDGESLASIIRQLGSNLLHALVLILA